MYYFFELETWRAIRASAGGVLAWVAWLRANVSGVLACVEWVGWMTNVGGMDGVPTWVKWVACYYYFYCYY